MTSKCGTCGDELPAGNSDYCSRECLWARNDDKPYRNPDILEKMYVEQGKTQSGIADELGCSPHTINLQIREHGIGEGATCPTCGRDDFRNEHGMRIHHETVHGKSLRGTVVECHYCGEEFRKRWGNYRGVKRHFCSWDCRKEWGDKETKTEVECEWCNSEFRIYKHEFKVEGARKGRFCSKECHGEWASENRVGEYHPNWRGGHIEYYGPNWLEQRRRARERDGCECQSCGTTEDEIGRELDVHHKNPFRTFVPEEGEPDYEKANALSNLISLCPSCHQRTEAMAPLVPTRD